MVVHLFGRSFARAIGLAATGVAGLGAGLALGRRETDYLASASQTVSGEERKERGKTRLLDRCWVDLTILLAFSLHRTGHLDCPVRLPWFVVKNRARSGETSAVKRRFCFSLA